MASKKQSGKKSDSGPEIQGDEVSEQLAKGSQGDEDVEAMLNGFDIEATSLFEITAPKKRKSKKISLSESQEVQDLLVVGKKEGAITVDALNQAIPDTGVSGKAVDSVLQLLADNDIEIVDDKGQSISGPTTNEKLRNAVKKDGQRRSADPVRVYLRRMGSVPLLSREGEVEIAKRIEEGENELFGILRLSPMTIQQIIKAGDKLETGKIRLRELVAPPKSMDDFGESTESSSDVPGAQFVNKDGAKEDESGEEESALDSEEKDENEEEAKEEV